MLPGLSHHGRGLVQQLCLMVRVEGSSVRYIIQNIAAHQPVPETPNPKHVHVNHSREKLRSVYEAVRTSRPQPAVSLDETFLLCRCTWLFPPHRPDRWAAEKHKRKKRQIRFSL